MARELAVPPESSSSASRDALRRAGYTVVRGLIDGALADTLWWHARAGISSGTMRADGQVPGALGAYGDPVMERVLEWLQPSIEDLAGCELYPTYSYYRVYTHGNRLRKHVDRPSCEVSVTLNLGQDPPQPWPLGFETPEGQSYVELEPGDAALYLGTDRPHWRDAYAGRLCGQAFLHYVGRHGRRREWRHDKRESLNLLGMSDYEPLQRRLEFHRASRPRASVSSTSPFVDSRRIL